MCIKLIEYHTHVWNFKTVSLCQAYFMYLLTTFLDLYFLKQVLDRILFVFQHFSIFYHRLLFNVKTVCTYRINSLMHRTSYYWEMLKTTILLWCHWQTNHFSPHTGGQSHLSQKLYRTFTDVLLAYWIRTNFTRKQTQVRKCCIFSKTSLLLI